MLVFCERRHGAQQNTAIGAKLPQKKFGTIARFYSGIPVAETSDVNGFSRIKDLRRALSALDMGGWERQYHQKLFYVSVLLIMNSCRF